MLFVDLDSTLLDVRSLFQPINDELVRRHGSERVAGTYAKLAAKGFSQREHLLRLGDPHDVIEATMLRYTRRLECAQSCLYPGVLDLLDRVTRVMPTILLTAGDAATQRAKLDHLPGLRTYLSEVVIVRPGAKGDVVAQRTRFAMGHHWVVDDSADNLRDVEQRASWVSRIRMDWCNEANIDDGLRWSVAHSSEDVLQILGLH